MAARHATMHECATVYGVAAVYDILEVMAVEAHNRRAAADRSPRER